MLLKEFFDLISSLHRIFQSENFSFSLSSENSLTWGVKYEKLYFRRSWNLLDKLRKSYRNGTVVKKLFTFLKLQKILGNFYSSEQIFEENSHWVPLKRNLSDDTVVPLINIIMLGSKEQKIYLLVVTAESNYTFRQVLTFLKYNIKRE